MPPVRIAVHGANGRVGRLLVRAIADDDDLVLAAALDRAGSADAGRDVGALAGVGPLGVALSSLEDGVLDGVDVVVDFSAPEALDALLPALGDRGLVSGTTGLTGPTMDRLAVQAERAPVVVAANFSTGVAVLRDLVARAARALPDYDIEILEAHHRHKQDAPSGTALVLGHAVATARGVSLDEVVVHGRAGQVGPRRAGAIGMHAVRGGGIVGDHQVWLVGEGERLQLGHVAIDRATFARGALRAARWAHGRPPGRYDLDHVLGLAPVPGAPRG